MDRNTDRVYYDKGYSDGVRDTQRDAKVPKLIGVACLSALLIFDQYWPLAFVILWAMFELESWWDLKKYHKSDPPPTWNER